MLRIVSWLDEHIEPTLNFLFYTYLASIIVIEVFRRYVFNDSTTYGEETARYAFVWMAYIAAARGARQRGHLSIDIFRSMLGRSGQFAVWMLSDVCFLILAAVIIYTSIGPVLANIEYRQTFTGLDAPMWLATIAVPVGWTLIAIRVIQRNITTVRAYRRGQSMEPGVFLGE